MWNCYSFQPVGPWMACPFTDQGDEGCCRSLNALLISVFVKFPFYSYKIFTRIVFITLFIKYISRLIDDNIYQCNDFYLLNSWNYCSSVYIIIHLHARFELPATWWRHQMEAFSALLTICAGNSPVPGEFPPQRPVMRSFDFFFDLRSNWVNNGEAGDLRRHRAHYDVIIMNLSIFVDDVLL